MNSKDTFRIISRSKNGLKCQVVIHYKNAQGKSKSKGNILLFPFDIE